MSHHVPMLLIQPYERKYPNFDAEHPQYRRYFPPHVRAEPRVDAHTTCGIVRLAKAVFYTQRDGLHLERERKKCAAIFGARSVKNFPCLTHETYHTRINRGFPHADNLVIISTI